MDNMLNGKLKRLDKNIFLLRYDNDYALDMLLDHGVSNVGELVKVMQKYFMAKKGELKIKMGDGACTIFNTFKENGQHIMARNFDYKDAPCIVVWTTPKNGYKSVAITDTNVMLYGGRLDEKENPNRLLLAPYTCMDGVNEKGLSIAVAEIKTKPTKQKTGKKPITTTVMIRAVLDKCATVEEAIELFKQYDMHDSLFVNYHYQVTDANGKSAVIEYINNEMVVVYPEDKTQYILNFYATPNIPVKKGFGYTREKWLHEEFEETGHVMDEERAMKILERCRLNYKHKRGYMITSLWSAVYNLNDKSVLLCAGMDYTKQYKFTVDCPEEMKRPLAQKGQA